MSEDSADDDLGIKPGSMIDSQKANYVVLEMLGEGGFGAGKFLESTLYLSLILVFKVYLENDKTKEYAMKVEKKLETRKHSKLKMEVSSI
jgi:hypothetical protein